MFRIFSPLVPILTGIGAFTLLSVAYFIIRFLTFHLIKPSHLLQSYKRADHEPVYALITGSSAGIGLGIAQALVKEGFAVILLGHLPDELDEAKATLQRIRPDAVVRILVIDVRTATPKEMDAAVQSIVDLQVSILVNNVGGHPIKPPIYRAMETYSIEDVDSVINMNARFMARLTVLLLPILSRKPRSKDRSLILNISSGGRIGLPLGVMYGATKSFNWGFSCGLARELEASQDTNHIDCLAIIPGEVRTQSNTHIPNSEPGWDQYGQCVIDKVDNALSRGQRDLIPYMMHDIKLRIGSLLPEGIKTAALTDSMRSKRDALEKSR
jgi:17beta-estradiol 17-dehydrogenase / very-long-chain 3-oxoacyl-CoA reductase